MGDAPNELEVLEARREILQLEIALAQERRAAAEAEQKGMTRRALSLCFYTFWIGYTFPL